MPSFLIGGERGRTVVATAALSVDPGSTKEVMELSTEAGEADHYAVTTRFEGNFRGSPIDLVDHVLLPTD